MNKDEIKFKIKEQIVIGHEGESTAYAIKGVTNIKIIEGRKALEGSEKIGCTAFSIHRELPFSIRIECCPFYILSLNSNGTFLLTGIPKTTTEMFVQDTFEDILERGSNA